MDRLIVMVRQLVESGMVPRLAINQVAWDNDVNKSELAKEMNRRSQEVKKAGNFKKRYQAKVPDWRKKYDEEH